MLNTAIYRKVVTSLGLLFQTSLKRFSRLLFNSNYIGISLCYACLLLITDVCSRAAAMEVRVYLTGKSKLFHACAYHLGLETDVKLDRVIITRP